MSRESLRPFYDVLSIVETVHAPHVTSWVNRKIPNNFFRVGEQSPVFKFQGKNTHMLDKTLTSLADVRTHHGRSHRPHEGLPDSLTDEYGNIYFDFDIKGGGTHRIFGISRREGGELTGVLDYHAAKRDSKYSDLFSRWGIRTHRSLAIAKIEKFPFKSRNWKRELEGEIESSMQCRMFRNNNRIRDFIDLDLGSRLEYIQNTMHVLNESEKLNLKSVDEYVQWYAKTMGRNYGIMHEKGFFHQYATEHNMTLACEVTDFDTVYRIEEWRKNNKAEPKRKGDPGVHLDGGPEGEVNISVAKTSVPENFDDDTYLSEFVFGRALKSVLNFSSEIKNCITLATPNSAVRDLFLQGYEEGKKSVQKL